MDRWERHRAFQIQCGVPNQDFQFIQLTKKLANRPTGFFGQTHCLALFRRNAEPVQVFAVSLHRMMTFLKQQGLSVEDAIIQLSPAATKTA